ncbi:MAG TPA: hypothetical protein VGF38_06220 [Ktedonobacterales bacterium]|jgi:hypothetical protein
MNYDPSKQHAIWHQGMDEAGRQAIWGPDRTTEADMVDGAVKKRLRRQRIISLVVFLVILAGLGAFLIARVLAQ